MMVGRDHSFRNWNVYQDRGPPWVNRASIDRVRGFRTLQEKRRRGQSTANSSHKIRQKHSSGGRLPLHPASIPKQARNTGATCRGNVDKATAGPAAHTRMTGEFLMDVVVSHKLVGSAWLCARHEFCRWEMCRRNDFTTTHFVLSQNYFR